MIDGLDPNDLGDEFGGAEPGKVLILDGDGPAYVVAATVKTVPTAVRHYHQKVLQAMFLAGAETAKVHLTHEESLKAGRFLVNAQKPYQGQRASGAKPPLLHLVRRAVCDPENSIADYTAEMHYELEADDAMMMDSYALKEFGIIRSEDKDLRMTPWAYYDIKTGKTFAPDTFGHLYLEFTESGTKKCLGHSLKFFWAQMMMGDSADNIKGLCLYKSQKVGPSTAFDVLDPLKDIHTVANTVIDAYRHIDQNPIPEGWLLWMLRHPGDSFWKYCQEIEWSNFNKEFLQECMTRPWYKKDGE